MPSPAFHACSSCSRRPCERWRRQRGSVRGSFRHERRGVAKWSVLAESMLQFARVSRPVTGTQLSSDWNVCQVMMPTAQPARAPVRSSPRDEILRAARRLFAERGYARTSVRDIAQAAGVSAQTVYDSVGSKQALVARLNDLIDAEAGHRGDRSRRSARTEDPARAGRDVGAHHALDPRALRRHRPRARHRRRGRARARRVLAEGRGATVDGAGRVVGRLRSSARSPSDPARPPTRWPRSRRPLRARCCRRATAGRSIPVLEAVAAVGIALTARRPG